MTSSPDMRTFSESKHLNRGWQTRVSGTKAPLTRILWNLISFKREGIQKLASSVTKGSIGLDIGCGTGAYSHWFLGKKDVTIVSSDWSLEALQNIPNPKRGSILRVCSDAQAQPFKESQFDFFFTVDTLGHIEKSDTALNEMLRVAKPGSPFFVHSECCDYQYRWPDNRLIKKLGKDILASQDGHIGLRTSGDLYQALQRRFTMTKFFVPAGILGWLMGYPEKYITAFRAAKWHLAVLAVLPFIALKKLPLVGALLRLVNVSINRLELFLGITGGGSCFAHGTKPEGSTLGSA